jgi:hypothetical protein
MRELWGSYGRVEQMRSVILGAVLLLFAFIFVARAALAAPNENNFAFESADFSASASLVFIGK